MYGMPPWSQRACEWVSGNIGDNISMNFVEIY